MMTAATINEAKFVWEPQPAGQALVNELLGRFLAECAQTRDLVERMKAQAGTRLFDWIDHLRVPAGDQIRAMLREVGFVNRPVPGAAERYVHEGATFAPIILTQSPVMTLGIKVDSVADFAAAQQLSDDQPIIGEPMSPLRFVVAFRTEKTELVAVERHGHRGFSVPTYDAERAVAAMKHLEAFRRRRRTWPSEEQAFDHAKFLASEAIADLGRDFACDLFFAAERDYWMRRNTAARVQYARQSSLGLGWANHDHHTFRSTRRNFHRLIELLEMLGFFCRERFYAGAEAGWGAQVLEQPETRIVIFADVDLAEEEVQGDFAHEGLTGFAPGRNTLGTVGLWCALHGESALEGGLHHLECEFDHEALTDQLGRSGIGMMARFTDFPFLKQAFTEGERWPVKEERLRSLLDAGHITPEQAEAFRRNGAIGSHLENLERNDGYKGFNQRGVSDIIQRTDARRQVMA